MHMRVDQELLDMVEMRLSDLNNVETIHLHSYTCVEATKREYIAISYPIMRQTIFSYFTWSGRREHDIAHRIDDNYHIDLASSPGSSQLFNVHLSSCLLTMICFTQWCYTTELVYFFFTNQYG